MTLLSLGIVRGILGQVIGTALGMGLVTVLRLLLGLPVDVDHWEPAVVIGCITGFLGFMVGSGSMTDWFLIAIGRDVPVRHGPPKDRPAWTRYFSIDYSHKVIGIQYTVAAILVMLIAGSLAMAFRVELVRPELQVFSGENVHIFESVDVKLPDVNTFNTTIGTHGFIMIVSILLGISGLGNYVVPLMLGAKDMAFPRLNAFAFWINVPVALMLVASIFVQKGWDTGWTAYPPLSVRAPLGMQFYLLGVYFAGTSSVLGAVNLIVTILRMRPPGMTLFRMPIFCWSILATSFIALTATQLIALSFLMVSLERVLGMGFFDPAGGGQPILFQHLFWFYSHPAVYIFVLPGLGIISELLPVFSRKPLFGYKWIAMSSMAIAFFGMLVWAHHMFTSGMAEYLRVPFMYSTLLVAVPTGVKFFSWVATIWRGKLTFETPMLFVLGAISVFLIGGLTGPPNGVVVTDLYLHDTYWIVGHFHATMFGGFVFPFFAGLYYWYPKVTGRKYSERLGKLHFWIMTPAFWLQSLGQMWTGLRGMRRRIADYDVALGIQDGHLLVTIAGFLIGLSVLIMIYNLMRSLRKGEVAEGNPWNSRGLEWQLIDSPVPEVSFDAPIEVVGEPYDYGLAGSIYAKKAPVADSE